MEHPDHVALLRPGVPPGGAWADIGAGEGAFTLALADLLGPGGSIVPGQVESGLREISAPLRNLLEVHGRAAALRTGSAVQGTRLTAE